MNLKQIRAITHKDKKPLNKKPHVGVEIEFYCLAERGLLALEFLRAGLKNKVKVGYDGSIDVPYGLDEVGFKDHEVKVIDTEDNILQTIEKVCEIIKKYEGQVNKSCGLHVHLDMRHRDREVCYNNLVKCQKLFFKLNPSRRKNDNCVPNKSPDYKPTNKRKNKFLTCGNYEWAHRHDNNCFDYYYTEYDEDNDKYKCVNKTAYQEKKTIEVRVHKGTVSSKEINDWLKLLIGIVNKKEKIEKEVSSMKEYKLQFTA